ncbi:MAG: UDP-N-acetylmuramoyl-tripeptide--D-alanyl-D-alanine ligase [Burkholderiales bacterium]|nr:UDP-N-acetylmuramoyl-tripeptide--D-alanyl-D-alanine ligase [Burkholderiales bacterium]
MRLQEAAEVLNARRQGDNVLFTGVSTDSRTVCPGELFVALTGENYDGHQFVRAAREQGAVAAMVEHDLNDAALSTDFPLVCVENTRSSLGQLSARWRQRFSMPLAAVTGSNGKTTVKEMLAAILRCAVEEGAVGPDDCPSRVLATVGNLNNDIGVPLMLLRLREIHQYAVIEMGMNHAGEIAYLTRLAQPDVAVITNAGAAHIEGLGSVEAVARAKGEIFAGLSQQGAAVINADDDYAPLWRTLIGKRRVIDFGFSAKAQVSAEFKSEPYGSTIQLKLPDGIQHVTLKVPGTHNIRNGLAAAAAAVALGVNSGAIVAGLERFKGVQGRLQIKQGRNRSVLIDDSYNANPESVKAALAVLAAAAGKKILILGDMGELGKTARDLHRTIGEEARLLKLDELMTVGELSRCASDAYGQGARHFNDMETLLDSLENRLDADVTVLVKGSRFMHMERIVNRLEG